MKRVLMLLLVVLSLVLVGCSENFAGLATRGDSFDVSDSFDASFEKLGYTFDTSQKVELFSNSFFINKKMRYDRRLAAKYYSQILPLLKKEKYTKKDGKILNRIIDLIPVNTKKDIHETAWLMVAENQIKESYGLEEMVDWSESFSSEIHFRVPIIDGVEEGDTDFHGAGGSPIVSIPASSYASALSQLFEGCRESSGQGSGSNIGGSVGFDYTSGPDDPDAQGILGGDSGMEPSLIPLLLLLMIV